MKYTYGDTVTITGPEDGAFVGLTGKVAGRGSPNDTFILVEINELIRTMRKEHVEHTSRIPVQEGLRILVEEARQEERRRHRKAFREVDPLRSQIVEHLTDCGWTKDDATNRMIDFEKGLHELGRARGKLEGLIMALALTTSRSIHDVLEELDTEGGEA